jgi:hypothetical protein
VPIAERWFLKPQILETSSGMHRFVWDLRWKSSGGPIPDDDDSQIPSGPKAVPGRYEVRLTVDGLIQNQPLRVVMDPRSPATPEVLAQHLDLAKKIFAESMEARRALAEMNAVEKQVGDAERQLPEQDAEARSALTEAQAQIKGILTTGGSTLPGGKGMENAYADLLSELHAVESGDRGVPSQAIDAYDSTSPQIEARVREWAAFKQSKLEELNRRLRAAGQSAITISQIEREVEDLMTR